MREDIIEEIEFVECEDEFSFEFPLLIRMQRAEIL